MNHKELLKIHWLGFESSDLESSGSETSNDIELENFRPPPVQINPSKVVVIKPKNEEKQAAKKAFQEKRVKTHNKSELENFRPQTVQINFGNVVVIKTKNEENQSAGKAFQAKGEYKNSNISNKNVPNSNKRRRKKAKTNLMSNNIEPEKQAGLSIKIPSNSPKMNRPKTPNNLHLGIKKHKSNAPIIIVNKRRTLTQVNPKQKTDTTNPSDQILSCNKFSIQKSTEIEKPEIQGNNQNILGEYLEKKNDFTPHKKWHHEVSNHQKTFIDDNFIELLSTETKLDNNDNVKSNILPYNHSDYIQEKLDENPYKPKLEFDGKIKPIPSPLHSMKKSYLIYESLKPDTSTFHSSSKKTKIQIPNIDTKSSTFNSSSTNATNDYRIDLKNDAEKIKSRYEHPHTSIINNLDKIDQHSYPQKNPNFHSSYKEKSGRSILSPLDSMIMRESNQIYESLKPLENPPPLYQPSINTVEDRLYISKYAHTKVISSQGGNLLHAPSKTHIENNISNIGNRKKIERNNSKFDKFHNSEEISNLDLFGSGSKSQTTSRHKDEKNIIINIPKKQNPDLTQRDIKTPDDEEHQFSSSKEINRPPASKKYKTKNVNSETEMVSTKCLEEPSTGLYFVENYFDMDGITELLETRNSNIIIDRNTIDIALEAEESLSEKDIINIFDQKTVNITKSAWSLFTNFFSKFPKF